MQFPYLQKIEKYITLCTRYQRGILLPYTSSFSGGILSVVVSGDWIDSYDVKIPDFPVRGVRRILVVADNLGAWDTSLLVFLQRMATRADELNLAIRFDDFPNGVTAMMELTRRPVPPVADVVAANTDWLGNLGEHGIRVWRAMRRGTAFAGRAVASVWRALRGAVRIRPDDWWRAFDDVGPRAILIVSLISFLIGLILAFVGAAQLKLFGAQVYVASLVAIAAIRIMGAMMTGIIMAGRTGASYAATIGTMQVNEELDAMHTMGIDSVGFLVAPRMAAMVVSMPVLTLLADIMAILGGAMVGIFMFNIPPHEYISYTAQAVDIHNFMVGVFHGLVYGIIIALCGCYYGITCGRNADAVGRATTRAVVAAIVWMVVATGIITFLFEVLGI